MEENKNRPELSDGQLDMVSGGNPAEAQLYLEQLSKEKGVDIRDLDKHMTIEEYVHYCDLYSDYYKTNHIAPKQTPKTLDDERLFNTAEFNPD